MGTETSSVSISHPPDKSLIDMNQLTAWDTVFTLKLTVPNVVKRSSSRYGNWKTITVLVGVNQLSLSWNKSMQSMSSILLHKIHFNITSPNIRAGFEWPPSFRFPDQSPVCISPFSLIRATCTVPPTVLDLITDKIYF
jgi:hypothetical protein